MRTRAVTVAVTVMLTGMLIGVPLSAAPFFPRVTGSMAVEGIVVSVNVPAAAFTIRASPGPDVLVWLHPATQLNGASSEVGVGARRISATDVRSGDRVRVTGFALDDGRLLALRVGLLNRRIPEISTAVGAPAAGQPRQVMVRGVVVDRDPNTLAVLDTNGRMYRILVTATTHATGQQKSPAAVASYDSVRVHGSQNPDGSISAERVEVITTLHGRVEGRIVAKSTRGPTGLTLESTAAVRAYPGRLIVNVSLDASLYSRGRLRSFGDLREGQTVRAFGTLISIGTALEGGTVLGFDAWVIVF